MPRASIKDFELANPLYRGASVTFYTVAAGVKTNVKATLYAGTSGATQLANPQRLDSHGRFKQPVYIDVPVIGAVDGISIPSHDTGIVSPNPAFRVNTATGEVQYSTDGENTWGATGAFFFRERGAWAGPGTAYKRTDMVTNGGIRYVAKADHSSTASFAADLASSLWAALIPASATFDDLTVNNWIRLGDGSAAAPSYSFGQETNTGWYRPGSQVIALSQLGLAGLRLAPSSLRMGALYSFGWASSTDAVASAHDLVLVRDAANTLAQRNGANAQSFRVYNTFTDAGNYERARFGWASNTLQIGVEAAGTGVTTRSIMFSTAAGNAFNIQTPGAGATDNFLAVIGRASPSGPILRTAGTDTDIPMELRTKGTGAISFTTDDNVTSAIQFRVGHTASAVNFLQATGGSTGNEPRLTSTPSADTNIGIRYDTKGTGTHRFYTNTTVEQFRVSHTASAVNFLQASGGATGSTPFLVATGADTDVSMAILAKGAGAIRFGTNSFIGNEQFRIAHTASAVNLVQVQGNTTGNSPLLRAAGTDTNVNLAISGQGTGVLQLMTGGGSLEQVRVLHIASAVNRVTLAGGATGNTVSVGADGETDVALTLSPKGAGALVLNPSTGDIRWNKANVALGGGAAPTLGTIGGTGPAAAAQRNWLRFLESDGTASFIPVWR